jgi:hypothetical protein
MDGEKTASLEADPRDNLAPDMNRDFGVAGYINALYLVVVYSV